jgi:hypothetical protein
MLFLLPCHMETDPRVPLAVALVHDAPTRQRPGRALEDPVVHHMCIGTSMIR